MECERLTIPWKVINSYPKITASQNNVAPFWPSLFQALSVVGDERKKEDEQKEKTYELFLC